MKKNNLWLDAVGPPCHCVGEKGGKVEGKGLKEWLSKYPSDPRTFASCFSFETFVLQRWLTIDDMRQQAIIIREHS